MNEEVVRMIKEQFTKDEFIIDIKGVELNSISKEIRWTLGSHRFKVLVLSNCKLKSLKNFPKIYGLLELDLSDNYLQDRDL